MNDMTVLRTAGSDTTQGEIIKLAVLAVGGQGGGVLGNWIEDTARSQGYACQATSVAGVAQRTGSTVYYIEMAQAGAGAPVFSLAPSPGDVDIVIGAELMEAGRAIMRRFVTPDKTTLIASTHRVISIAEKTVPGDGVIAPDEVVAAAEIASHKLIAHDLDKVATESGSVISASLFGALAGSGALPFARQAFEDAIKRSGRGVDASLKAFGAAFELAEAGGTSPLADTSQGEVARQETSGPPRLLEKWEVLVSRIESLPEPARPMAELGLRKVVDFQNASYGEEFIDRLERILKLDSVEHGWQLTTQSAKYIANAMAYDDVIRVADIKTRGSRFDRVRNEIKPASGSVMNITEFMHPRAEEIVGLLPVRIGRKIEADEKWMRRIDRWFNKGRRVRTDSMGGFSMLYFLGGLRNYRTHTLRHAQEQAHLNNWLSIVERIAGHDYDLAVETVKCRRLVKGYSDTHSRSRSKFDKVVGALDHLSGREDAADWLRRLREAALQDEHGKALDGALKTIASFTERDSKDD